VALFKTFRRRVIEASRDDAERPDERSRLLAFAVVALLATVVGAQAPAAASDTLPCPPPAGAPAYAVSLRALTGPQGADLTVRVVPAPDTGCATPEALKKVQVKVFAADGTLASTHNLQDVDSPGGSADLRLGQVARHQKVAADVLIQNADATRTYVLRAETTTLLRPDLVVSDATDNPIVFATRPFQVAAQISERNGDIGAAAVVTLRDGKTTLDSVTVDVAAGGSAEASFHDVALTDPGRTDLTVSVRDADPAEADATNNTRNAVVDVINIASHVDEPLAQLGGYGAQMNQNVYAPITGAPLGVFADLESKVVAQQPGIVRVFFNDVQARTLPGALDSFYKTLQLAQRAGATINVTLQSTGSLTLSLAVTRFSNALNTAVKTYGVTNLRWVTIQNEPNSTKITPDQLELWYRALDAKLRALGLRDQIRFMGLDLVATDQQEWFAYAANNMSDLLDAYSIHVFWDYWDTAKLEQRLEDIHAILAAISPAAQKPVYSMEYGVRGIKTIGATTFVDPGVWDQTQQIPLTQTNVNAFQQGWFDVLAAQLGFAGTVKWDSYYGKYDNGSQAYYMLGQWDDSNIWPVYPIYDVVRLFTQVTHPGWNVTSVEQDSILDTRLAASYAGPNGEMTVVGLDRAGAQLNGPSPTLVPYAIGGLPHSKSLHLIEWNQNGDGRTADAGMVTTDDVGVARIDVPLQAIFALTTG
jgi:hypothetical protein